MSGTADWGCEACGEWFGEEEEAGPGDCPSCGEGFPLFRVVHLDSDGNPIDVDSDGNPVDVDSDGNPVDDVV